MDVIQFIELVFAILLIYGTALVIGAYNGARQIITGQPSGWGLMVVGFGLDFSLMVALGAIFGK